jgi:uncharacterized damage-inducible protein DinB
MVEETVTGNEISVHCFQSNKEEDKTFEQFQLIKSQNFDVQESKGRMILMFLLDHYGHHTGHHKSRAIIADIPAIVTYLRVTGDQPSYHIVSL